MVTNKSWEKASAPVEGYIVPPGESLERPLLHVEPRFGWDG